MSATNVSKKSDVAKMKSGDWSGGDGLLPGREALGPLLLMMITPQIIMIFCHVISKMDGNFVDFANLVIREGFFTTILNIWPSPWDPKAWKMIGAFLSFQLMLQKYLPGKILTQQLLRKEIAQCTLPMECKLTLSLLSLCFPCHILTSSDQRKYTTSSVTFSRP
jgi:hypothetical protein